MTKEIVSDILKTLAYFYHRGIGDGGSQFNDSSEIDAYVDSNPLSEFKKFRFIHGEHMSLKPLGGPAFKRMFSNVITSRLPNIEKRRELTSGALFKYQFEHGYYMSEVYSMACYEYRRGLLDSRSLPYDVTQAFLESFYDKVSYSDINPVTGKKIPRTKQAYLIFCMYNAACDLHPKRRAALSEGYKISSKLENFAGQLQRISFMIDK